MRVLFSFAGGRGHVEPLLPVAEAARAAGHAVAFAGAHTPLRAASDLGFDVFPLGSPPTGTSAERLPLQAVDVEREERDLRERFARRAARERLPAAHALQAAWRPDVVVCDETDFGGMLAAELSALPCASVLVTAAGSFVRPDVVAAPLDELRAEHGLPPDPGLAMLTRQLVLSPFPPSFRDPRFPLPATAHSFRLFSTRPALDEREEPVVYFTLGTVFNLESGDLFARVLAGLSELPVGVVVTVGSQIDPDELGPLPDNIHVERFIPQLAVLPRCDAVVSHGGSGTVVAALAHGLPQVVIPLGADQPLNAERCEQLGVGLALDPVLATPELVRDAVAAVLAEPSFRAASEKTSKEIAALPDAAHAVRLLERLGAGPRSGNDRPTARFQR